MRQATMNIRVSALVAACTALLTACGGSDSTGGTAQSIDFAYPGPQPVLGGPAPLTASATSGLPVTFTSNTPAICTIADSNVVPVTAGECSVTATQAGDSTYTAATPAQQLFNILRQAQGINFPSPGFQDITATTTVSLSAAATSGLPVSFASTTPDVCTVTGTTLTLVSMGTCKVAAQQAGDATYAVANPSTVTFLVGDARPPVLSFVSGFTSNGTIEGGAYDSYAGSNQEHWWCSDPNWCSRSLSTDGLSYTINYWFQPNDPKYPNTDGWTAAFAGIEIFAPGVTNADVANDRDTTVGMKIGKQSTVKLNVALDPLWYSTIATGNNNADINVNFVMGHFAKKPRPNDPDTENHWDPCNITLRAVLTPSGADAHTYELALNSFNAIAESCGVAGLDPAAEMANYPIVKIKIEAAKVNMTASSSTDPQNPKYPTAITVTVPITLQ